MTGHSIRNAPPLVWALLGDKAGDNAQVVTLAAALGWPFEPKRLAYNVLHHLPNPLLGESCASLDRRRSDALAPPWPDLVIGVGRRSVPVARWIRRASGGRTRLVRIGRPRAPSALFDLVVTTPQYDVAPGPNVVELPLPITASPSGTGAADPEIDLLPRPRILVLAGGPSAIYRLRVEQARELRRRAEVLALHWRGSLLVTTSRRTPPEATAVLTAPGAVPMLARPFGAKGPTDGYQRLLAAADIFVVTADSASMIADARVRGRPIYLFEATGGGRAPLYWRIAAGLGADGALRASLAGRGYRWLLEHGYLFGPRRLDRIIARLYRDGAAAPLPVAPPDAPPAPPQAAGAGELEGVVGRVRGLLTAA